MNYVIINIKKEAKRMGMSKREFKESCQKMIKLGFMQEV
jgi:hypothetical protein